MYPIKTTEWIGFKYLECPTACNDPTIVSYNNYHVSENCVPRGNKTYYSLVYFVYKNVDLPRARPRKQWSSIGYSIGESNIC